MSAGSRGAEHGALTRNGGELFSVMENNEEVHPGKLLQSYLETILSRVDRVHTRTLVYTRHHVQRSGQLTGQFSLDPTQDDTLGSASSLRVTLTPIMSSVLGLSQSGSVSRYILPHSQVCKPSLRRLSYNRFELI